MKRLISISIFLVFVLVSYVGAEEKKYLNIGADPVEIDVCKKRDLKTYKIEKDRYVATTAKSRKVSVGWIKEGEEIGILSSGEQIICSCGNSVKFLDEEKVKIVEKIVEVPVKAEKEPESDVIVIVVEDDYEEPVPAYYPYRSYPYYSGYSYPAISYSYEYRWPSYRHYNYNRHRHNYPARHRHYRHHRR